MNHGDTERRRVEFKTNTVACASAGTGKTTALVGVYLQLLEEGADPLRIVAMTFTEKAAAEMRERVREGIYKKLAALPITEQGCWMRILGLLPVAPISTIHSFSGLLLREHGLLVGADPSFTILDEQRGVDLCRECAVDTVRKEIRNGNAAVERLFGDFGLERLVEAIESTIYWINSLGVGGAWLESRAGEQRAEAERLQVELRRDLEKYGNDPEAIGDLADRVEATRTRHPLRDRKDPRALLPRVGQIAGASVAAALARLVDLARLEFQGRKRALNVLDFDDLLLGARDLLKNSVEIREHYKNHFEAVLVDEFQDTDEVQAEIISYLAEQRGAEGVLAPRKLFIVGDPKQSIYRFRRARVTVFLRMLKRIAEAGGTIRHLAENHRSAEPLVHFSNALSQVMLDGRGKPGVAVAEGDLSYRIRFSEADLLEPRATVPFRGITYIAAAQDVNAATGRAQEAEAIARLLKKWMASGTIQSWKEVAMLFRTRTNVEVYVRALERHDLPLYVVQGTGFFERAEVSDLIALLEMIVRPQDRLARASVLTSALAGVSFKDLLESPKIDPLSSIIQPWVERRDRATAAEILEDVVRKTNYDVVMMAQKDGQQRVANIGKLIEITRELARQGTTALDEVVRYLRARAHDVSAREPEAQIAGQEDNVVRMLTVHQAKGLEFDVVILPDLAVRPGGGNNSDRTFRSDRWGLLAGASYGVHRRPLPHSLILTEKALEDDQQFEEEKRLLYVAVTRARSMLVLGEGYARKPGLWLQWVKQLIDRVQRGAVEKARRGQTLSVKTRQFAIQLIPAASLAGPHQLQLAQKQLCTPEMYTSAIRTSNLELRTSNFSLELTASDLSALDGCFRYFYWTRMEGLVEPGALARLQPAMKLGSLAHKMLESEVMPTREELAREGLTDLGAVFDSEEWRRLVALSPERELPFILRLDIEGEECFVRGRMDVVVPGNPPRVIDYKYATWKEGEDAGYQVQMSAYSLALMKSLGTQTAVSELWYLKAPMTIIRQEHTLAEAGQRISDLFLRYRSAVLSGNWPRAQRSYCDHIECGFRSQCWGKM